MKSIIPKKQLFSKQQKNANKKAFESFDLYKKTIEIMDRANIAMGRKTNYTTTQSSTLNYKTNIHGYSSTQKI
jgi:hypothetical protein